MGKKFDRTCDACGTTIPNGTPFLGLCIEEEKDHPETGAIVHHGRRRRHYAEDDGEKAGPEPISALVDLCRACFEAPTALMPIVVRARERKEGSR